jgi:hypothetical protein
MRPPDHDLLPADRRDDGLSVGARLGEGADRWLTWWESAGLDRDHRAPDDQYPERRPSARAP